MEHTRTSPEERRADPATGAVPGVGSESAGNESSGGPAEQTERTAYQQSPPEPVSVETAVEEEIMSKLPRKRPQRRSARRPAAASGRKRSTARAGAAKKSTAKRASTARGKSRTAKAKAKNDPSLPEQAIGAVISTARLPLRITASVGRRASDLIGRLR